MSAEEKYERFLDVDGALGDALIALRKLPQEEFDRDEVIRLEALLVKANVTCEMARRAYREKWNAATTVTHDG